MRAFGLARIVGETWLWWIVLLTGLALGAFITCAIRVGVGGVNMERWPEMATAIFALLAFIVALLTYRFTLHKHQKDLFVQVHDKLIDPEIQKGRGILAERVGKKSDVGRLSDVDFRLVNASLALYDTLAMYTQNQDLKLEHVRETWGTAMHRQAGAIRVFIDYREDNDRYRSWPHLRWFLSELDASPPLDL